MPGHFQPCNVRNDNTITANIIQPESSPSHPAMTYLSRPQRYLSPPAVALPRSSANKISKMSPSRATVNPAAPPSAGHTTSAYSHPRPADTYRPGYDADTYRTFHEGAQSRHQYSTYGEPTNRGYYDKPRIPDGESLGGSWPTRFESGCRGGFGQRGSHWYDLANEVQPPVSQQSQYYRPDQAIQTESSGYEASSYYGTASSAHPWQRSQQEYCSGQGREQYHPPDHYGRWAAYPTSHSAPSYGQGQEYVHTRGYSHEQLRQYGHEQRQHLTQNCETATTLKGNAPAFQPLYDSRTPSKRIDDIAPDKDHRSETALLGKKKKKKQILKRPSPTPEYLEQANQFSLTLDAPRELLIVLDLNGTLLHRPSKGGANFVARPKVKEFIRYLLTYHKVMVWSSAQPENVNRMCEQLVDEEQHQQLVAVWARDTLRIPASAYYSKVQVYKRLSWAWQDQSIQAASAQPDSVWDQSNTVLIDDSAEKAASEPHNLICLEEFQDRPAQRKSDVLGQVVNYLEALKHQNDVSAFMQMVPFTYDAKEKFDWEI